MWCCCDSNRSKALVHVLRSTLEVTWQMSYSDTNMYQNNFTVGTLYVQRAVHGCIMNGLSLCYSLDLFGVLLLETIISRSNIYLWFYKYNIMLIYVCFVHRYVLMLILRQSNYIFGMFLKFVYTLIRNFHTHI